METQEIDVYGTLSTNNGNYWLIHPRPIENFDSWLKDDDVVFYVIPKITQLTRNQRADFSGTQFATRDKSIVYPYPRHIILSGNYRYQIEYLEDISIQVKKRKETHIDNKGEMFRFDGYIPYYIGV